MSQFRAQRGLKQPFQIKQLSNGKYVSNTMAPEEASVFGIFISSWHVPFLKYLLSSYCVLGRLILSGEEIETKHLII